MRRITILVLAAGLLASGAGSAPVQAAAAIAISPASGPPGTSITVTGSGFGAGETGIAVTYDGTPVVSGVSANSQGSWSGSFVVPASASGPHTVVAAGSATPAVSINFTVSPAATISRTSGTAGASVTVTGSGFGAGEIGITVTYDGSPIVSGISASPRGAWSGSFLVPPSASGPRIVGVYGSITSAGSVPGMTFTVSPIIGVSRTSGTAGTAVTVTGSGFGFGEAGITVTYDGTPVASGISASSQGSWSGSFVVPASASGPHMVGAYGTATSAGSVQSVTFTISPTVAISRTSGTAGAAVTVTGSGFGAGETGITITFDGTPVASGISASSHGAWSGTFAVPPSASGPHSVGVYGSTTSGGSVPAMTFTVSATVTISRTSGPAGAAITVTGSGFGAGETGITVAYDGASVASGISASSQGAWRSTFVVPASASGPHTIAAAGSATPAVSVIFAVSPAAAIGRTSGTAGAAITVTGSGFGAGETGITVTYDGAPVASGISANPQGSWSGTFVVPASASGPHSVGAYGSATSAGSVPTMTFTVSPTVAISRTSGTAGASITVTGSGFGAGETGITVTYDGAPVASGISANARGGWTGTFFVPASASGSHIIAAFGSVTRTGSVSEVAFSIAPGILANPDFGHVGRAAEVTGSGFAANSPLRLTFDDREVPARGATTDASGTFSMSITIPRSRAGPHTIKVVDGQNNDSKVTFTIDSTPPSAPTPLSPGDDAIIGILGDVTPTFRWSNVTDPSGVTYSLQVDTFPDFSQPFLEKTDITEPRYAVVAVEALPRGRYYWRVRAVNGASVQSNWSQTRLLNSGLPLWVLLSVITLAVAVVGAGVYLALARPWVRRREAVALPEIGMPPALPTGQLPALESGETPGERQLPWRLALPEPKKEAMALTTQDQARLIVIMDFAQSLPLVDPGYDVNWLVDLTESGTGTQVSAPVYGQLLGGGLEVRYEPAWMRHPVYQDLTAVLEGQPVLQDLSAFVDAVNECASQAVSLLREIYRDTISKVSEGLLEKDGWKFVSAVYSDALSWFRGKSLREPSERDYATKPQGGSEEGGEALWLCGEEATSFAGPLVQVSGEPEALQLRSLHLELRRTYRNNNHARQVAAMTTELEVRRSRLLSVFSQIALLNR